MTSALAVPDQAQRDAELYIRLGGPPTRKAWQHRTPPPFTLPEQALVTVLRQRFGIPRRCPSRALRPVVTGTIAKAERQAQPLLARYGTQIEPATAPIKTLEDLTAYGSADGIKPDPQDQTSTLIIGKP